MEWKTWVVKAIQTLSGNECTVEVRATSAEIAKAMVVKKNRHLKPISADVK